MEMEQEARLRACREEEAWVEGACYAVFYCFLLFPHCFMLTMKPGSKASLCARRCEFCIKNDEFCIQNDEYCIKTDEFSI